MISCGPGAALTLHVLVSWCCVLLTAFTCDTCFLRIYLTLNIEQGQMSPLPLNRAFLDTTSGTKIQRCVAVQPICACSVERQILLA